MPRAAAQSIEDIIRSAVEEVVAGTAAAIQKTVAAHIAQGLRSAPRNVRAARRAGARPRRRPAGELTRWVADRRARRVPNFVIEATGLDTKKKIVAKYGPNAAFEKSKPLPPLLAASADGGRGGKARRARASR